MTSAAQLVSEYITRGRLVLRRTQTKMKHAFRILEDLFESFLMKFGRSTHKLGEFVDGVANVRSCKVEILQLANDLSISSSISGCRTIVELKIRRRSHRSCSWVTSKHVFIAQDVSNIMRSSQNKTIGPPQDFYTNKVAKVAEIFNGKMVTKERNDLINHSRIATSDDNIININ